MPRALVAEDDREIRRLVTYLLEHDGYEVATVMDGNQAIEAIAAEPFDVILLDFMLPWTSGFRVIDWIEQNRPGVAKSRVIVITAAVEQLAQYDTSRIYAAVPKPFDVFGLRDTVRKCIEEGRWLDADGGT